MIEKIYAGTCVTCNDLGYMTNLDQWNRDIGTEIAKEEGIDLFR